MKLRKDFRADAKEKIEENVGIKKLNNKMRQDLSVKLGFLRKMNVYRKLINEQTNEMKGKKKRVGSA